MNPANTVIKERIAELNSYIKEKQIEIDDAQQCIDKAKKKLEMAEAALIQHGGIDIDHS